MAIYPIVTFIAGKARTLFLYPISFRPVHEDENLLGELWKYTPLDCFYSPFSELIIMEGIHPFNTSTVDFLRKSCKSLELVSGSMKLPSLGMLSYCKAHIYLFLLEIQIILWAGFIM